jgi:hypothetical protein
MVTGYTECAAGRTPARCLVRSRSCLTRWLLALLLCEHTRPTPQCICRSKKQLNAQRARMLVRRAQPILFATRADTPHGARNFAPAYRSQNPCNIPFRIYMLCAQVCGAFLAIKSAMCRDPIQKRDQFRHPMRMRGRVPYLQLEEQIRSGLASGPSLQNLLIFKILKGGVVFCVFLCTKVLGLSTMRQDPTWMPYAMCLFA